MEHLKSYILDVADYPKPGIMFKDFTPLLADPRALALSVELMANPYRTQRIDLVAGAESRGFIFGTAVAQTLSAGFIPLRKKGKLPRAVRAIEYELEYGTDRIEIHADAIPAGARVLLVDDLLATGGTLRACTTLLEQSGANVVGITVLIELMSLHGRAKIDTKYDVHAVLRYS